MRDVKTNPPSPRDTLRPGLASRKTLLQSLGDSLRVSGKQPFEPALVQDTAVLTPETSAAQPAQVGAGSQAGLGAGVLTQSRPQKTPRFQEHVFTVAARLCVEFCGHGAQQFSGPEVCIFTCCQGDVASRAGRGVGAPGAPEGSPSPWTRNPAGPYLCARPLWSSGFCPVKISGGTNPHSQPHTPRRPQEDVPFPHTAREQTSRGKKQGQWGSGLRKDKPTCPLNRFQNRESTILYTSYVSKDPWINVYMANVNCLNLLFF